MSGLHAAARPEELVPGDEAGLESLASVLRRYGDGCTQAVQTLRAIDDGAWVGEAADAFRAAVDELPGKLDRAATAFGEAVRVVRMYVEDLRRARTQAQRAIDLYAHAEQLTGRWEQHRTDYRAAVAQHRTHRAEPGFDPADVGMAAPAGSDPGAADRAQAERLLRDARADVEDSAEHAARALRDAAELAPDEPGLLSKAVGQVGQFLAGAGEALYGLAEFAFKLSPAYLLIDPEGFVENATGLAEGLWYGIQHPREFGKALLDWDTWAENPARALGHLVPDLLLALATGGAGTAAVRTARAGRVLDDLAGSGQALRRMVDAPAELRASWAERFGDPGRDVLAVQGKTPYGGVDEWATGWAEPGLRFNSGWPGPSQFVAPHHLADDVGRDAGRYYEGLQVQSFSPDGSPATYRPQLKTYEVVEPMPLGVSVARHNPQFGPGGLPQYYVPDNLGQLLDDGFIRPAGEVTMNGTVATIQPPGVPGVDAMAPRTLGENVLNGVGGAAAGTGAQTLDRLEGASR
ncbi:hypothetical protein DQ239_14380 [Blastococcus sp. TF02-09]|uniref:putative T7SS-secreted protein n=1 Tax=Blastococcus sp. TF02-09 TaxID=2250576 RepID=UPI000DEA8B28|nr:hypothetical protein [Blastococcus sp. TF02-9]RBY76182.1 hypothetical protein DQ239_14380 [Blastococcus sp. TF02-9]